VRLVVRCIDRPGPAVRLRRWWGTDAVDYASAGSDIGSEYYAMYLPLVASTLNFVASSHLCSFSWWVRFLLSSLLLLHLQPLSIADSK
jgi:hypothetical protein